MNLSPDNPEGDKESTPEQQVKKDETPEQDRKIRVYVEPDDERGGDHLSKSSREQADFMMAGMAGPKIYKIGDKVTGKVVQVKEDSLVVNIGTKNEGIVPCEELSYVPNPSTEHYKPGDEIDMVVIRQGDDDTYFLSKKRAEEDKAWKAVEEAYAKGTRINAVGSQIVNAGLILDMGIRAFMPLSHADIKRIDVQELIGKEFQVKVLEFNKETRPQRLVVSRRAVLEEDLTRERDSMYEKFQPGEIVKGKVEKLTSFGAFVNLGGVTGLLHVSQMSRRRVNDPSEVVKIGDEIDVKIIDVDREKRKIRLTRRDLVPDPWDEIEKQYKPGDVVDGVVVRVTTFGAFIKIDNYYEGLAHISELVDNKINHAKEVFSPGDRVPVMILEIDTKRKRIRLSAKKAVEKQARREVDAYLKQQEDIRNIPHISTEATEALKAAVSQPPSPVEEPVIKPTPTEVFASPEPAVEQFKESLPEVEAAPAVEEGVSEPQVVAPRPDVEIASYAIDEAPDDIPAKDPDEVLVDDALPTTPEPAAAAISTAFDGGIDDEERDLISGEEYDDTGQPDLPSNPNSRGEGDEIDLIEGSELEDK